MGTSHELGQNFARAFGIQFSSETGTQEYVWQTSWGASTRLVGALIMAHGDDAGLRLPPRLAPVQVVVVLVRDEGETRRVATALVDELRAAGLRIRLDDRVEISFGRRSIDWELKGVPVRLEIGPRDLAGGQVTLVRRDLQEKRAVPVGEAAARVRADLEAVQAALYAEALERQARRTTRVVSVAEAAEAAADGFAVLPWDTVGLSGEEKLASEGCTVRCLQATDGSLPGDENEAGLVALVAKAY
jgi:prolyl-tRNA synthetase